MDEEHEEKTGEIQRATHDDDIKKRRKKKTHDDDDKSQDSHLDYIPFDLTLEILSRLAAKSIVRYRCVSKNWSSITTLPSFIDSFGSRSSARPPRLLLSFILKERKRYFISFPQHHNPDGSSPPFYSYHITDPIYNQNIKKIEESVYNQTYTASESVHGLILFNGNRLWNPSLRRFLPLPPHPKENIETDMYKSYLGYDPSEDKHKVLSVLQYIASDQPYVLTLGAQESWRIITKICPMHCPLGGDGRCVNGILYYEAGFYGVGRPLIMSFDVKSEKFNPPIKFPGTFNCSRISKLSSYEGKLAFVMTRKTYPDVYLVIDLYILKDATGDEWTLIRYNDHVDCDREWTSTIIFRGITGDNELIFAPCDLSESFYILYYDPKRNITTKALFKGIMEEEIKNYGTLTYNLDVFPNHIESLFSM